MKKDIHPADYRLVIFEDVTAGKRYLLSSTIATEKTDKWSKADAVGSPGQPSAVLADGKEYPLFQVEISSASHPFYTGQSKIVDTAGRVEKFKTRSAAAKPKKAKTAK